MGYRLLKAVEDSTIRKYPILAENLQTGQTYKFAVAAIREYLGPKAA